MRKILPPEIEAKRVKHPDFEEVFGPNGFFVLRGPTGADLRIQASDGKNDPRAEGFEHVSVAIGHRIPNWLEMQFVKKAFWLPEEAVYQLHPPESQWVNNHPRVLHLWRHPDREVPLPPAICVGIKEDGTYTSPAESLAGYHRAVAQGKL